MNQDLDRIQVIAADLDPPRVSAEVSLMTGARLKAWTPDAGPSSNAVDSPALADERGFGDHVDRWYQGKHKRYRRAIADARKALERAIFIQNQVLTTLHDGDGNPTEEAMRLAAEDVSPQAESCPACGRVVERTASDRLRAG